MPCYHPLRAFPVGEHPSGKPKYRIMEYAAQSVPDEFGNIIHASQSIPIPCGKCIGCRLQYSRDWANRCMLELQYHDSAYFLTLTYDNEHLPYNEFINPDTGEISQAPVHTLVKKDFQDFMKRLRKNTSQKIRFFGCGEYGSDTHRPHYHIIVFGLELNDLKILKTNFRGEIYYTSPTIEKCWKKGYSLVCDVTWDTCAYVARYVTKKLNGKLAKEVYEDFNLQQPFSLMSRRPGIAAQYFYDNYEHIYRYDRINLSTASGGKSFKPPRYYDKLYDIEYHDDLLDIKINRENVARELQEAKVKNYDGLSYEDILYIEEDNLLSKLGHIKERNKV